MFQSRLGQLLAYLAVRVSICFVQTLRLETCSRLAAILARLCYDALGIRRKVTDENLRLALPHFTEDGRRTLGRLMWEHLFLLVAEVALVHRKIHETNWRDYVEFKRVSEIARLVLSDRPVLLVSAHFGNFELAGYVFGMMGYPTTAVARTLDNPYLAAWLDRFRGTTGQSMVPKKGGYEQIVRVLSGGGTMSFLADQYAGSKGCWVDFFGRPASAHKAIALLALEHDAPLVVGYARRKRRPLHYELGIQAVLDPREASEAQSSIAGLTQWYTHQLEAVIRTAPEQYWWLHRRWKDSRPPRRRRVQPQKLVA
ncbi:MAG: lysophospholipid acyltransferase family protein [Pirellulales bacterium]